jgi:small subunit ribosomal protein S17e
VLVEKYYTRLTFDFQTNKKISDEVAIIPSKRLRNKIAGFATVCARSPVPGRSRFGRSKSLIHVEIFVSGCTARAADSNLCVQHLMKRISRGPVRGISLKLQEEERERRMDVVPDRSALDADTIDVDPDTKDMLKALGVDPPNVQVVQQGPGQFGGDRRAGRARN